MSWPLLGLTRATEDEYCARSEHAFLFACFQQQRYFRQSEDRWNELARTAETVVVFVDFTATAGAAPAPRQVPVPAGAPLGREWVVVCEAPGYPVCLAGWEFPGPVRDAAVACARLAESFSPGLTRMAAYLDNHPA